MRMKEGTPREKVCASCPYRYPAHFHRFSPHGRSHQPVADADATDSQRSFCSHQPVADADAASGSQRPYQPMADAHATDSQRLIRTHQSVADADAAVVYRIISVPGL